MADAEARAVFAAIDSDGDGALSSSEVAMRLSDFGLGDEEITKLFFQLDTNGDGQIDIDEWVSGFSRYQELVGGNQPALTRTASRSLEADILAALVEARARPDLVAERVKRRLGWLKGKEMRRPGRDVPLMTKEGRKAVDDALSFLEAQPPLPGFSAEAVEGLALAAADHVADIGAVGEAAHSGSDGSSSSQRQARYGSWKGKCGECLWYGKAGDWLTGRDMIEDLIVDDGVASRGHRLCIYDEAYTCAGVSVGKHAVYSNMAAIEFAKGYEEDGELITKRQAEGPPKIAAAADGGAGGAGGPKSKAFHKIGGCVGCGQEIRGGTVIEVPGVGKFHGDCFVCTTCSVPLAGVASKKVEKGCVYCSDCWGNEFADKCAHCDQPITASKTTAGGKAYHPDCWKTVKASKSSGGSGGGKTKKGGTGGTGGSGGAKPKKTKGKAPKAKGGGGGGMGPGPSMGGARNAMDSIGMDYANLE
jgi:hypothetical protein